MREIQTDRTTVRLPKMSSDPVAEWTSENAELTVVGTDGVVLGLVTDPPIFVGYVPPHRIVVKSTGGGSDSANVNVGYCNNGKNCK